MYYRLFFYEMQDIITLRIIVKKKPSVLDVEGKTIEKSLKGMGFVGINKISKGTSIDIEIDKGIVKDVDAFVSNACSKLFVNEVIEAFEYQVIK